MKKLILKLSVLVMILTLVTLPLVSGTYAKYATEASATDSARVAKWGVTVALTGDAFQTSYLTNGEVLDVNDDAILSSVVSSIPDPENLVAPGTSGVFGGVDIAGTPEVAVTITKNATLTLTGWNLGADFYCPIVITVNGTAFSGLSYATAVDFEDAVESAIEAANGNYQANTDLSLIDDLSGDYSWAWAFTGAGNYTLTADVALDAAKTYYTTADGGVTFTQVISPDVDDIAAYYEVGLQNDASDTAIGDLATLPTIELEVTANVSQID